MRFRNEHLTTASTPTGLAQIQDSVRISGPDSGSAEIIDDSGILVLICDKEPYHAPAGRKFKLLVENKTQEPLYVKLRNFQLYRYPDMLKEQKMPGDWEAPAEGGPVSIASGGDYTFKLKTNNSVPGEWYKFDLFVTRPDGDTNFDPELQIDNPPH